MSINESYILADSDVLGSFDFFTYNITMFVDDSSFIKDIVKTDDVLSFEQSAELYSIMLHEYRHYYDMTHTVYGFNFLKSLDESLSQGFNVKSGDEFNYYKIKEFVNDFKKIRYPKYYNILFKEDDSKRWQLKPTIGKVFDTKGLVSERPILFARYYDENDNLLCRHPFSMVSLLECSATLDEYISLITIISASLKDKPANKGMLIKKFEKKSLDYIYNINLVEYSTCFHMIANHFQEKELQNLFKISRILLDICLNFTDTHFELIQQYNLVDKLYRINPNWSEQELEDYINFQIALKRGIEHKERPILFYVLLSLMDKNSNSNSESICLEIDRILGICSLNISKIFEDAKKLISDQTDIVKNSKIEYFSIISKSVKSNLNILKDDVNHFKNIDEYVYKLDVPAFETLESFTNITKPKQAFFSGINYHEKMEQITKLKKWVDEFNDACFY